MERGFSEESDEVHHSAQAVAGGDTADQDDPIFVAVRTVPKFETLPSLGSAREDGNSLTSQSIMLRLYSTPMHHVVGKCSSFSGDKRVEALNYFLEHREEVENGKDISELTTDIPHPNLVQAALEYQLFYNRNVGRLLYPFYALSCNGLQPIEHPGSRDWKSDFLKLSPVNMCYNLMTENILQMSVRLLETHQEVERQAMCFVSYVYKDVAIDGGMNRWPVSRPYHTVRMRPVIDGSHYRVRHESVVSLTRSGAPKAAMCLLELALKLADDFARLDIPELSSTEVRLNFLNYFRGYKGTLSACVKLLMSRKEEAPQPLRLDCIAEGSYHLHVLGGKKHLKYCGHSKYAIWAVDFIQSVSEPALAPRLSYFDNLHSSVILSAHLWTDDDTYSLGERIRSLLALVLCDDIPNSDRQEWYLALEDCDDLLQTLSKYQGACWTEACIKLDELLAKTSGFARPLETVSSAVEGISHHASWLAAVPSVSAHDPAFCMLSAGKGWTIDGDLTKKIRIIDTNGDTGDLFVEKRKARYKLKKSTKARFTECLGRVNSVKAGNFEVKFAPIELSDSSTSAEVIHAALSGVLGVRAGLFIIKKMFLGSLDISEDSLSTVASVCAEKKDSREVDCAKVDSFLSETIFAEMAVVTDGEKYYTALADSQRCVEISRNRYGRYKWKSATLPDIDRLKKGLYRYPALVE